MFPDTATETIAAWSAAVGLPDDSVPDLSAMSEAEIQALNTARWLATGGGTLSHELTHALMEADFPNAPGWISEGLASLHEQLGANNQPLDNYRYYYLEFTLEKFRQLIPLKKLLAI